MAVQAKLVRLSAAVISIAVVWSLVAAPVRAQNQSGTWVQDATGLWSNPSEWLNGIANGAGFTADFSTINIVNSDIVTLDSSRSIGQLKFGDTTPGTNTWTLASSGGSILTFDNGASQPVINEVNNTAIISAVLAGSNGVLLTGGTGSVATAQLNLSGANTYSGVTTITSSTSNQFTVLAQNNAAFGTSSITFNPGGSDGARIRLDSGVNIPNNITFTTVRSVAGNGAIMTNGDVTATWSGSITKNGTSTSGGEFVGPVGATTTNFLILSGPIINNLASVAKNAGNVSNTAIQVRAGNIRMADTTGTSSTFRIEDRNAILQVGATNGIATNSYVDIGGNVGNPGGPPAAVLDLNGFNQTLVGVSNYLSNTQAESITNSSTTTAATLTLAPANPTTDPNQALLVYSAGAAGTGTNATITDATATAPLNIVVNGDAAGVQYLTTPNGSYRGSTTLTSGKLAISTLAAGGANSSIGASSNAASNLIFNGGTLRYVNQSLTNANVVVNLSNSTTPSTDRNFTINAGSSGTIDIASPGTTLTWSGGSANTTGSLIKAGAGTLILTGASQHTGGTTVTAGTLRVLGPSGSLSTGTVTVASLATLGGDGTIGGTVSPSSGGILAPGNPAVNSGVGTLTVGGLTLNNGSTTNFEFGATNDEITVTGAGGLTINGGNLNLYTPGTTTAFSADGTYTLLNINGGFSGLLSSLTVANSVAGKFYNLTSTATAVQLVIGDATTSEWNNAGGTGLWDTAGNWTAGEPNAIGTSAKFGSLANGGTVSLSESETVSGLIFDSANSYVLSGAGGLSLNNGVAAASVVVNNGSHTIAVPVSATNATSVSFANNSALTVSGAVSGGKPLNISGAGTLTLTGGNSFSSASVNGSTLNVGTFAGTDTSGSLGTSDVTLSNSATLNFNRSNSYSFSGGIAGSGGGAGIVQQLGSGTTTVSGAMNNVTGVNVSAGTLVASSTINQSGGILVSGTGSLTANGAVSGAGGLTMSSTGTVNLNAADSYFVGDATTAGTTISAGTVNLNASGALPANSALAVNGGTLNLNGTNISLSNILDTVAGGAITNNGAANSTSTISFTGSANNYNLFAALNDGSAGGKVALVTSITNVQSGNIYVLHLNSSGTFSGGVTVNSQSIEADATDAFGTGPITINANNASTSSSQILLGSGVSLPNNITIAQGNPHPVNGTVSEGVIQPSNLSPAADSTVSGTITILANNLNDGLFNGPSVGGTVFLDVTGPVIASGTATNVVQIGGQVKYGGGGSYPNFYLNGTAALSATNGLATNAVVQFSTAQTPASTTGSGTFNVAAAGTLDLNGFDQTLVALSATSTALASTVQNSGTGTNTLTLNTSGTNNFNGAINGNINLVVGGSGTQQLTGGASSNTGITTITGTAVLEATVLASGGTPSSIGAATNAPANLVFDGGTLRYTGASSVSIDRGFTINAAKTANFDVATAATNLTLTGSSPASTGGLTKLGPGTLTLDATATLGYTGATTISGGVLAVNNNLTSTTSISIASGAFLTGSGSIGGTLVHTAGTINPGVIGGTSAGTFTFTGPLTLNGGTVQYDVDGANLSTPSLQDRVVANGGLSIAGPTTIDLEFLNPSSPPTSPFDYVLFNYTGAPVTQAQANNLSYITNIAGRNTYSTSVATAGQVSVHVVPVIAANLNWNSTTSGAWDTTTANWFNTGTNLQDKFFNGDNVTFPDGAGLQTNIVINTNTTVSPSSMTVTANTNNYTISGGGAIGGAGTLTMNGTGTLRIQTNNTYSGGTTINAGTVNVGANSASGTLGTGPITNNASLIFSRTDGNAVTPLSFPNSISGTGSLTLSFGGTASMTGAVSQATIVGTGIGTANLTNSVTTTGVITVSAGVVNFSGSVTAGGGINVSGAGSMTSSGGISGSAGITLNTTGFATVSGSNSYDGNTIISAGTFFPNDPTAFGSTIGSTTVNSGGSIFSVQNNTYNGEAVTINGTGNIVNGVPANDGALHAGGATTSTFDGPITVASNSLINLDGGATLSLTNTNALTGSNVTVSLAGGGTLSIGGNVSLGASGSINTGTTNSVLTFAPPASTTITVSSPIVGNRPVNFTTAGTPSETTLGTTTLAVDNPALTGPITISSGNLAVQTSAGLGTGAVTINGTAVAGTVLGSLQFAPVSGNLSISNPITIGARMDVSIDAPHLENISGTNTFSGAITLTTGGSDYNFASDAGLLTIQSAFSTNGLPTARNLKLQGAGNGAWTGVISDVAAAPLTLVMNGTGTWTLSGANTYTGGTTVNSGTLTVTATGSIGGGPLTINAADTITSVVNLESSQTVSSLAGTNSGSGSARVNVGTARTLTDTDTAVTTYAGSIGLATGAAAHSGGTFSMTGSGTLETQSAPSLGGSSNINVSGGGTLRFNVTSGAATVGTGVVATVTGTSTLELAGTVSGLSNGTAAQSASVTNNSTAAAGLLVSGTNQRVGGINGTGTTQVNAGSDLTANHIMQSALVIGGSSGSPGLVTIAASDSSGNPLASASGMALAGSSADRTSVAAGVTSSSPLLTTGESASVARLGLTGTSSDGGNRLSGGSSAVPEPSAWVLAILASLVCLAAALRRRAAIRVR